MTYYGRTIVLWNELWYYEQNYGTIPVLYMVLYILYNYGTSIYKEKKTMVDNQILRNFDLLWKKNMVIYQNYRSF